MTGSGQRQNIVDAPLPRGAISQGNLDELDEGELDVGLLNLDGEMEPLALLLLEQGNHVLAGGSQGL